MAITWRNVDAPSTAGVAQGIQSATSSVNDAFGIFNKILQQREAFDANQVAKGHEANKQAFLDALQGAGSVEELAQLKASGNLDVLKARLNPAGMAAVRGADEARLTSLRTNATATTAYEDQLRQRKEAPIREAAKALIAQGKTGDARALMEANSLSVESDIYEAAGNADVLIKTRAQADADRKRKVEVLEPREDATAKNAATLQGLALTTAQQTAADAQESRKLETVLAAEVQQNAASQALLGNLHSKVATALKLNVVGSTGLPDFRNMSPDQILAFDAKAKEMGIPGSSAAISGDTARADAFQKRLAASGEFSPRVIGANRQAILNSFSSLAPAPVGNDAFNVALAGASNQVGFDRSDANNWYAPNSPDARKSYADLATQLPDILKGMPAGTWFGDNQKDLPDLQSMLGEVASVGIKRKDGTTVVPSVNDVIRFLRSQEGGFRDAKRAEQVKAKLIEWVDTPEAIKMHADGLKSQAFRDKQRVQQILRDTLNPPKK